MGVSLEKVEQDAPHLVEAYRHTVKFTKDSGLDPETSKAAVLATIDNSSSTRDLFAPSRRYPQGEIQFVTDLAVAAGMVFDDDGDVPVSFFNTDVHHEGDILLNNSLNYVKNSGVQPNGGTSYIAPLRWIIDEAGFTGVDLSSAQQHVEPQKSGLFGRKQTSSTMERVPQSVRATAAYPTFAIVITDGEPQHDNPDDIVQLVHDMSQLPIFIQFIGVGEHNFQFLKYLDNMEGRFVDNVNFFDAKDASNQEEMMAGLLAEFSVKYYPAARAAGLLR